MIQVLVAANLHRASGGLCKGQCRLRRHDAIPTRNQQQGGHRQLAGHGAQGGLGSQNTRKPARGGHVMDERIAKEVGHHLRTSRHIFGLDSVPGSQGWLQARKEICRCALGHGHFHLQLQPGSDRDQPVGLRLALLAQHMVQNDGATQTVSHQSPGHSRRSLARPTHDQAQVVVVVVESVDMPAPPLRTAVAPTVELSHRDPARNQGPSHVAIDPTVGAESMHRDQDQPGRDCGAEVLDVERDASCRQALFVGGLTDGVHVTVYHRRDVGHRP